MPILPLLVIIGLYALNQIAQQSIRQMLLAFISLIAVMDTVKFMSESAWDRAPESIPLAFAKSVYNPILQDFNLSETDFPWFELISREYLSHLPARVMLEKIVTRLSAQQQQPVTLLSIQMGMIPYYLTVKHFGQVEFIDMRALTTQHFTQCALTREKIWY